MERIQLKSRNLERKNTVVDSVNYQHSCIAVRETYAIDNENTIPNQNSLFNQTLNITDDNPNHFDYIHGPTNNNFEVIEDNVSDLVEDDTYTEAEHYSLDNQSDHASAEEQNVSIEYGF